MKQQRQQAGGEAPGRSAGDVKKNKWNWTPLMIDEGHRPGNYRPAPDTIASIEQALVAAGVPIPPKVKANNRPAI